MRNIILLITLMLAACVTGSGAEKTTNQELDAYMRCNRDASQVVSTQQGDPLSLAIAARSMCPKEDLALHDAIYASYNLANADRIYQMYKREVAETNAGDIVKFRARRQ